MPRTKNTAIKKRSVKSDKVLVPAKKRRFNLQVLRDRFATPLSNMRKIYTDKRFYLGVLILGVGILGYFLYKYMVIAWVDKMPITRIQLYRELEEKYGKVVTDQLVDETLILSEAGKRGFSVGEQEIEEEIKKIEVQQGGAENLKQILALQGLSIEELKSRLKFPILIKKMFSDQIFVSDEEVSKYIEENKASLLASTGEENVLGEESDSSSAAKLKKDVLEQLKEQKIQASFSAWLKTERESKRVVRI